MARDYKKEYAKKLLDPRWQRKRLEILSRDDFACFWCGDRESTLHVHHQDYIGENPWDTPNDFLITLCHDCHSIEHLKLTPLEKFLIDIVRNRDRGDTGLGKLLNKHIRLIKEG